MRLFLTLMLLTSLGFVGCAQEKKEITKEDLDTQMKQVSYSIGHDIGKNLKAQNIDIQLDELAKGISDAMAGTSLMTEKEISEVIMAFREQHTARQNVQKQMESEKNKKAGEEFLAANKTKEGVVTTASGLQYKVLKSGNGPKPTMSDRVKVHYTGKFIDGEEFDSSTKRGEPIVFGLNGVIKGWGEALQLMSVGDKWELFIPSEIAYGVSGKPPVIGPSQTLVFEVELIEIVK
jgi:FKBP-type peptidyl-prolyl cis-trans isomerase FklB